jgi:hypothetical protein
VHSCLFNLTHLVVEAALPAQVFRAGFTLGAGSPLRALFPWRLAGVAAFMPTSRRTADMAKSRYFAVQSALVSNREVPAASRISTTYRAERLLGTEACCKAG